MSVGLAIAGIKVVAGIDIDEECGRTYAANIPGAEFVHADVSLLQPEDLETRLGIKRDDPDLVLVACSPCQFYSQIRTNKTKSVVSSLLLYEFQRFVEYFRPGFVLIENVPRLEKEPVLKEFNDALRALGYSVASEVLNASNYGVPQNRVRYVMIATRGGIEASLPAPSTDAPPTVGEFIGPEKGFFPVPAGHRDSSKLQHSTAALTENNLLRLALTPPNGGDRSAWANHPRLQLKAYRGKPEIFRDSYGRMTWSKPAPTITTKFLSLSNGRHGHPTEARALSLREGATLQTFPRWFQFHSSSLHGLAKQVGNAVPPELARRLGLHMIRQADELQSTRSPRRADGRVARAKATLEKVRAAHDELVARGNRPTSAAILEITGGSKTSVLKHLRSLSDERRSCTATGEPSWGEKAGAIGGPQLLPVLQSLLNGELRPRLQESSQVDMMIHTLLTQAIALGYIRIVLTGEGSHRLGRGMTTPGS